MDVVVVAKSRQEQPLIWAASAEELKDRCLHLHSDYALLLKRCGHAKELSAGRRIHAEIARIGLDSHTFLGNLLVQMYGKCGCLDDAKAVFDKLPNRNVFSWTIFTAAHVENGRSADALRLFKAMQLEGIEPDRVTYLSVLRACSDLGVLENGKAIEAHVGTSFSADVPLSTGLINVYANCGSLHDAKRVFDGIQERDLVSWNGMVAVYAKHGKAEAALRLFQQMDVEGVKPNGITFASLVGACSSLRNLAKGNALHARIVASGLAWDIFLAAALVNMYSKCERLDEARSVFDKMGSIKSLVAWNAMIAAYAQLGHCADALKLFRQMELEGWKPNAVTLISILGACCVSGALAEVGMICVRVASNYELSRDVVLATALVNTFSKCGSLGGAEEVFYRMQTRNLISWNAMVAAYAQHGHSWEAFYLVEQMDLEGIKPNEITFLGILDACSSLGILAVGRAIHDRIAESGFNLDVVLGTALINMYADCGSSEDAMHVFETMHCKDAVAWNSMIAWHAQGGEGTKAVELHRRMELHGLKTEKNAFTSMLSACPSLAEGEKIVQRILASGDELDDAMLIALIEMHGKSGGDLQGARSAFDGIQQKSVASWTAMIAAYVQREEHAEAIEVFRRMNLEGVKANSVTLISILGGCCNLAEGKELHARIVASGLECDAFVVSAIVNMYGKCGSLDDATNTFRRLLPSKEISWNSMLTVYAEHGQARQLLQLFQEMKLEGVAPNEVSFTIVLHACSHAGLIDEAWDLFNGINGEHSLAPTIQHYVCVIDLLCRVGWLDQAQELIDKMPFEPNSLAWNTLLGACRVHGDAARGAAAAEQVIELEQGRDDASASYVLLSNMFAANLQWAALP